MQKLPKLQLLREYYFGHRQSDHRNIPRSRQALARLIALGVDKLLFRASFAYRTVN
jgi:hypothetical protein